ncbi:fact complex subunit spt16 [Ceraceosorus bombacis]|uniref:FACT complex subunit n=1 Tax=Ceraceosorus bombacis TaxID=401625 RepID=A0A0P1BFN1_9BASI|nr:fact complex subunit spt16 [Ceraceosorus bombacis]
MSEAVEIDKAAFTRRASQLLNRFKGGASQDESFKDVGSVAIVMGAADEQVAYSKTTALVTWLLGYEFPQTMVAFDQKGIIFATSASKTKYLENLGSSSVNVTVFKRTKDDSQNAKIWEDIMARLKGNGKSIGTLIKDKPQGKVAEEWNRVVERETAAQDVELLDVAVPLASAFVQKDEEELRTIRTAAKLSSGVMSKYFVEEMSGILDEEKRVTHSRLADKVEAQLESDNAAFWKKIRGLDGVDMELADWCYTPIVQSGGEYDLRTAAESTDKPLQGANGGGVILASLGMKYKSYCANVGRSWLVDPHKSQLKHWTHLLELQTELVEKHLKAGATCKDVYDAAVKFISSKNANLAGHFVKSIGFAIGIEFRDPVYNLNAKNTRQIPKDSTFNVSLGLDKLDDPNHDGQTYSLLLIDTIRINSGDAPATILTDRLRSAADCVFYQDEEDEEEEKSKSKSGNSNGSSPKKQPQNVTAGGKVLRSKGRTNELDASTANKIKEHQRELAEQLQEDGLAKYSEDAGGADGDTGKTFKKFESYKRDWNFPAKTKDLRIFVDQRAQTVFLPIYGYAVPYHINTIKNVSKSEEGDYTYLRFNFVTPGQIVGKKEDVPFEDPDATFIRSMSFRSDNAHHFTELFHEISDLRKAQTKKETEKKEMADVVEQDKLILSKTRTAALRDVFPRPALEGKRLPGDVEIHQNGLRFTARNNLQIDVLFNNMKHLFFQPCEKELIVLVHIHLKAPIIVGKKKTKDVQFYREASDVNFDETGTRKRKGRGGDEDEIELEQEERRRRHHLNKEFKSFAQKIADASEGRLSIDTPFRELGFNGVGHRSNVLLQPTTDCLIHLTDPPFTVITLSEVEIVHLERVTLSGSTSSSFDMAFVFKDFTQAPMIIRSVPMASLDSVKEWLDSVDLVVTEGMVNLNWGQIMKTVRESPYDFFVDGGWSFLQDGDDGSDGSESQSGSDFSKEVSDAEIYQSSSDDDDGSEFGDSEEDSGSGSEPATESDSDEDD